VGRIPRVAFFTDTFDEINGVALTSRQLTEFAGRQGYPFACVRGGPQTRETQQGSVTHIELERGPLAFELDRGLLHDPLLWRHGGHLSKLVQDFRPDIIHVVSPGDVSEMGVWLAKRMNLPLAISWHTNLHEFGAMRIGKAMHWSADALRKSVERVSEARILDAVMAFYRLGQVLYAPNDELVELVKRRTGKPVFLMKRGIDAQVFTPEKRTLRDGILRLGYVGRITPEKSVRFLRQLELELQAAGVPPFRFTVIGDGSEKGWLAENLVNADLMGIQRGDELAHSYANMDVFVFPSRTDTFGNVVLEALASGVPAVVTDAGGPKFIVDDGVSGFVARSDGEFIEQTVRLLQDPELRQRMACAARAQALGAHWDTVFQKVYAGYDVALGYGEGAGA
jgi:glycosyltransferase involved in cell wall biosynthesis